MRMSYMGWPGTDLIYFSLFIAFFFNIFFEVLVADYADFPTNFFAPIFFVEEYYIFDFWRDTKKFSMFLAKMSSFAYANVDNPYSSYSIYMCILKIKIPGKHSHIRIQKLANANVSKACEYSRLRTFVTSLTTATVVVYEAGAISTRVTLYLISEISESRADNKSKCATAHT